MGEIIINKNFCQLKETDINLLRFIDEQLSFFVQGAMFTRAFKGFVNKKGQFVKWDGKQRLLTNDLKFPYGLIGRVKDIYSKNNKFLTISDLREKTEPIFKENILPRLSELKKNPYPYQLDAIDKVKDNDCGIFRMATGSGKCNSIDSLHITSEGILDYSELLDKKILNPNETIEFNSSVATPLTQIGIDKSSLIYYDGVGKSIHIKTRSGFELKATYDHKIKVLSEYGNIEWKKAGEIQPKDIAVICPGTNLFGKNEEISLEDAYWFGLLIGDGGYSSRNYVGFTNQDKHILDFVYKYTKDNNINNVHFYKNGNSETTKNIKIYNVKYRDKLKSLGFNEVLSTSKTIPESLRRLSKPLLAMVVRGMYETDGWIENKPCICIAFSSKKLVDQLQLILLNFGIVATRRVKPTTRSDSHVLTIYRDFIPKFIEEIGLDSLGHKFKKLNMFLNEFNKKMHNSNNDVIPFQSHKLHRLLNIMREIYGYSETKNIFKYLELKWKVYQSWIGEKYWRNPSRRSLIFYINKISNYLNSKIIDEKILLEANAIKAEIENIYKDNFYYDEVIEVNETISDNYDFVVPKTHSFVSQGFINHNTCVSTLITASIGKKTIVYVIGTDLLYQTYDFFKSVFGKNVGIIGDGLCEIGDINIASIWTIGQALDIDAEIIDDDDDYSEQSVSTDKYQEIRDLLKTAKLHIFDECHLAACDTIQDIVKNINAEHIYGMSASPNRDDGKDLLVEAILGKNIVNISASELIRGGYLVKPIIKFLKVPKYTEKLPKNYQTIYKNYIVNNPVRNQLVVNAAERVVEQGYQTLVLFSKIAHGNILYNELSKKMSCILLSGKDSSEVRREAKSKLEKGEIKLVIASTIFDIGIDIPSLSGLILAGGGRSTVRGVQRLGRTSRKFPGKKHCAVVDFYDQEHYLNTHSKIRHKLYLTEPEYEVHWPKK